MEIKILEKSDHFFGKVEVKCLVDGEPTELQLWLDIMDYHHFRLAEEVDIQHRITNFIHQAGARGAKIE